MSNIHVPIDTSNLSEIIPEGEDILYSTMCKVNAVGYNADSKWESHVLVSKSGFASFTRLKPYETKSGSPRYKVGKKKEGLTMLFTKWEELSTNIEKPPFKADVMSHVLNPEASLLRRTFAVYKGITTKGFGHFCRDLWLENVMK